MSLIWICVLAIILIALPVFVFIYLMIAYYKTQPLLENDEPENFL